VLRVDEVSCAFGGLLALDRVSLRVGSGEIMGIMGPNGAGKTTLFNSITRFVRIQRGRIWLKDHDVTDLLPHQLVSRGLARTFQNTRLFDRLTVLENIMVALPENHHIGMWQGVVGLGPTRRRLRRIRDRARECLEQVGLGPRAEQWPGTLDYREQRLLGVARALASTPDVLLLDEPSSGLSPGEREQVAEVLRAISGRGVALLVIEHDIGLLLRVARRLLVLDQGRKVIEGTPEEVRGDRGVIEAYFGEKGQQWLNWK